MKGKKEEKGRVRYIASNIGGRPEALKHIETALVTVERSNRSDTIVQRLEVVL